MKTTRTNTSERTLRVRIARRAHSYRVKSAIAGFTLIEALVALTIFSFIGVAAYQLLSSTSRLQQSGEARFQLLSGLQVTVRALDDDFGQFCPRGVARQGSEGEPALDAAPQDAVVEFTRAGWRNPLGIARSGLQRVAWQVDDDGRLLRRYRRELDNRDPQEVTERVMLEGVEKLSLRYMDDSGAWLEKWPPPATQPAQPAAPGALPPPPPQPRAVEVKLVQKQIGEIVRVIAIR